MFLTSKGELTLRFKDGHEFDIGLSENKITNVFWGDMSEFSVRKCVCLHSGASCNYTCTRCN